jgi:hypothetical protein
MVLFQDVTKQLYKKQFHKTCVICMIYGNNYTIQNKTTRNYPVTGGWKAEPEKEFSSLF